MEKKQIEHPVSFRLDTELYRKLKLLATSERRSITKQLEVILKKALDDGKKL